MMSRWIYVLIGNNNTGKTTFQKRLIFYMTGYIYSRLDKNLTFEVTHRYAPNKLKTMFFMSRSFQEKKDEYQTVENYFKDHFEKDDICILSTHANRSSLPEVAQMIKEGRSLKYNIGAVFFSNAETDETAKISLFDWDERFYLENPIANSEDEWKKQIDDLAWDFAELLIRRAMIQ